MLQPDLHLCLVLVPKPGTEIPPGETLPELLAHPDVNSDGWVREWKVFATREEAYAYETQNALVLVVLPLAIEHDGYAERQG
jgi:hypothetical protein